MERPPSEQEVTGDPEQEGIRKEWLTGRQGS